jgi:KUP system potassium uptake protein
VAQLSKPRDDAAPPAAQPVEVEPVDGEPVDGEPIESEGGADREPANDGEGDGVAQPDAPKVPSVPPPSQHGHGHDKPLAAAMLLAIGVVYGDIGTSPLYSMRECFHGPHAIAPTPPHVLGVMSLVFWALIIVISVKYLLVVLRADNNGEGGILALLTLVGLGPKADRAGSVARVLTLMGIFGAALLYGDGVITPAISVLSAVEGLEIVTPALQNFVVPATVVILIGLFALQRRGTAGVGKFFGPITTFWFLAIAVLGVVSLVQTPEILQAMNPIHAARFIGEGGWHALIVLGSVFLVVTGGEAIYADMGHIGAPPIRKAWFFVVLPALLLNYFGQGALLLRSPDLAENPFYHLAPRWALNPLVVLATAATCIASQAVITGAFSLTWQAVQLGYLPRVEVRHTSAQERGQIYIPIVNWLLLVACIALVLGFRTSSGLAAAYGVAVTATMGITTILMSIVLRRLWKVSLPVVVLVTLAFLVADLAFFGANIIKVLDGGWFPLLLGIAVLIVMTTWRKGRQILAERFHEKTIPLEDLIARLSAEQPRRLARCEGTGVYLTGGSAWAPPALTTLMRHLRTVHESVVLLTVTFEDRPYVDEKSRFQVEKLIPGLFQVTAHCGYMERPHIPRWLDRCRRQGLDVDLDDVTFVLGRETLLATERPGMALWREKLFALLSRNAGRATDFFGIPADQVVEVGAQIEL